MFLVGLTGGIATGKSTVSAILAELGCPIVDADLIARQVVEPGQAAWRKIRQQFGSDVFHDNGSLDREKLGAVIFQDPQQRRRLNRITHPEIYKVMTWQIFRHFVRGEQFVVLDLPLLFETGNVLPYLHSTLVVSCDSDTQLERLKQRNNYSEEEALQRINSQMALAEKCQRATHVIDNSGSREETREQVLAIYRELRSSRAHLKLRLVAVTTLLATTVLAFWLLDKLLFSGT